MTKTVTKKLTGALFGTAMMLGSSSAFGQAFTENFDDITTLAGSGWATINSSAPVGTAPNWFQGNNTVFASYNGAATAYIGANYNFTTGANTISAWLITPNRTFRNGDVISFYTRKATPAPTDYPDRLQVRLSTNGASTNVGSGAAAVGDFTTLLTEINPTQAVGGYPLVWTQYTVTISGLPAPTSGRIAFRYFVTNGGPSGANSDYIGIDNVVYTPYVCPAFTLTTGGALAGGVAGSAYSTTLSQTGALGAPNFAVTAGALPPGLSLATGGTISGTPTATGTFNFTVTASDNSGCSGSQSYSITVTCPANPISFPAVAAVCSNAPNVSLGALASPAGGTFSGTGVTSGEFDPSAGTQTISYDLTDAYGCTHNATQSITVNTAPTVTHSAVPAFCSNDMPIALTGGSPAGGTYSGTGVTADQFDPAAGTQSLVYSYTDANGCTETASFTVTVNTAPTATQDAVASPCSNDAPIALTGGLPAGGTYTGTGVTGSNFDPSVGTQTLTYTVTDNNNCTDSETFTVTVNTAPTASIDAISTLCVYSAAVTLSGSPSSGVFSGTGVSGTSFDPATTGVGSTTVTYTYTDANNCVDEATTTAVVSACAGINEGDFALSVSVFPNPAESGVNVTMNLQNTSDVSFKVFDMQGKMLVNQFVGAAQGQYTHWLDISSLAAGTYQLALETAEGRVVKQIIKR